MVKAIGTLVVLAALPGCSWFQAHPAVAPDLQAVEACVAGVLAKEAATSDTAITIGVDIGVACGPDAVKVLEDALAKASPKAGTKAAVLLAAKH